VTTTVATQMQILMENGASLRILIAKTRIGDTASPQQQAATEAKMWRWHLHALVVLLGQTSRAMTAQRMRPSCGAQKIQSLALDGTANGVRSNFTADEMSALEACCACGGGTTPVQEVEVPAKHSKILVASIVSSLVLACAMAASTVYYRRNYNKILYAQPGQEHVRTATIGRKKVVATHAGDV